MDRYVLIDWMSQAGTADRVDFSVCDTKVKNGYGGPVEICRCDRVRDARKICDLMNREDDHNKSLNSDAQKAARRLA